MALAREVARSLPGVQALRVGTDLAPYGAIGEGQVVIVDWSTSDARMVVEDCGVRPAIIRGGTATCAEELAQVSLSVGTATRDEELARVSLSGGRGPRRADRIAPDGRSQRGTSQPVRRGAVVAILRAGPAAVSSTADGKVGSSHHPGLCRNQSL